MFGSGVLVYLIRLSISKILFLLQSSLNSWFPHYWAITSSHRFYRLSKRYIQHYSKSEILWEQASHPTGVQLQLESLNKHVSTASVHNRLSYSVANSSSQMISRLQAQNMLSSFTLHLTALYNFINIPVTSFTCIGRGTFHVSKAQKLCSVDRSSVWIGKVVFQLKSRSHKQTEA